MIFRYKPIKHANIYYDNMREKFKHMQVMAKVKCLDYEKNQVSKTRHHIESYIKLIQHQHELKDEDKWEQKYFIFKFNHSKWFWVQLFQR